MFQINKIAGKNILPQLLLAIALSGTTIGAGVYTAKQNMETADSLAKHDKWLIVLMAAILVCLYIDAYLQYRKLEKLSATVARKYLKQSVKDRPEMKDFDKVLDNPQAMKDIAILISNSLRPSERKLVDDIISKALAKLHKYERFDIEDAQLLIVSKKIFAKACADIIKIIKEHSSVHPEFIHDVYSALVYSDMIYIVQNPANQHTR